MRHTRFRPSVFRNVGNEPRDPRDRDLLRQCGTSTEKPPRCTSPRLRRMGVDRGRSPYSVKPSPWKSWSVTRTPVEDDCSRRWSPLGISGQRGCRDGCLLYSLTLTPSHDIHDPAAATDPSLSVGRVVSFVPGFTSDVEQQMFTKI